MFKRITKFMFVLVMAIAAMSSCKTVNDYIYLQDVVAGDHYTYNRHEPVVHPGDKLSIIVSCKNPELAIPFNSNGGVVQVSGTGNIVEGDPQPRATSYRVDHEGNIEFPILGLLHVAGMTSKEVQNLIKNLIIEGKYITNPLVTMEFLNFKFTVLGAVGRNGQQSSESGRVTLLEAIAQAGDLTPNANSKSVKVYREENGYEVMYEHDLTNSDFLNSPCYYLQQNDLVYVEPKHKPKEIGEKSYRVASIFISTITSISSMLYVAIALTNR